MYQEAAAPRYRRRLAAEWYAVPADAFMPLRGIQMARAHGLPTWKHHMLWMLFVKAHFDKVTLCC